MLTYLPRTLIFRISLPQEIIVSRGLLSAEKIAKRPTLYLYLSKSCLFICDQVPFK